MVLTRKFSWQGDAMIYAVGEKHTKRISDEMGIGEGSKGLDRLSDVSASAMTRFRGGHHHALRRGGSPRRKNTR